ncbi:MAG: zinc finger domain-containing protein [Thermoplasmata archaeon]|nr:zinc finger domain-containing protein [Thermoplasmata archaeon]
MAMAATVSAVDLKCTSCGLALSARGATHFQCPDCGEATLGRCPRCRDQSVTFRCPNCGFEGP